jgi:uncharacterized protein (DUF2164 family)
MDKRNYPSGKCQKRVDKIIISSDLEKEMEAFIAKNKPTAYTPEIDAIIMGLYGKVHASKVAEFINGKFGTKYCNRQINSRFNIIKNKSNVQ